MCGEKYYETRVSVKFVATRQRVSPSIKCPETATFLPDPRQIASKIALNFGNRGDPLPASGVNSPDFGCRPNSSHL
jgi:hypothetical protein